MAVQKTISLTSEWQSLNTLTSAPIGIKIDVQVIRGRDVRVATSDTKPDDDLHGFKFQAGEFFRSESGAKQSWVRAAFDGETGLLEAEY